MWLRDFTAPQMAMEAKGDDIENAVGANEDLVRKVTDEGTLDKIIERVAQEPGLVEMEILLLWDRAL
jgi:hypothetical protein